MFEEFQEGLREERPDQLREWEKMLVDWEDDHSKPCPYQDGNDGEWEAHIRISSGKTVWTLIRFSNFFMS